jgi:dipeptidyl aminopeptidase/acylaminoacyl peptidase
MERDLRDTPIYREVEAFYREALAPGFGSFEDVSGPEPSPDGRWVAFEGEVLTGLEGRPGRRIGLAAADGSGWRIGTTGPNDDVDPRWSPDGATLTFASDRARKGRFQLYALDTGAIGEARPLPPVPGIVEHHRWSPDGSRIAIVVAGERAEQADALGSGTLGTQEEHPAWIPEVESSEDVDEWRSLWILDVASQEVRRVSHEGTNVWEASWLGVDAVAAIVSDGPTEGDWYRAHLATIDATTGEERLLHRSDVQLSFAEGSPDGTRVALIEAVCSDRYVAAGDLLLVDAASGAARRIEVPADASGVRWRGDGLLGFALDALEAVAYEVDPISGTAIERWRTPDAVGGYQPAGAPLGEGGAFVIARSSWTRAPEIAIVDDGRDRTIVATEHAGHAFRRGHIGGRQRVRWAAPDGLEIDGLLTAPRGDGPFPTILSVHGGPVGATVDRFPSPATALLVGRGYAILAPNPRGSSGRGRAFAAAVVGDMGGADSFDDLAGIDAVVELGVADPERVGVMGGSYGGFMAAWLPTVDPRFKAAVSLSPVTDWYSEHFNSSLIDWVGDFLGADPAEPGGEHHRRSPVLRGDRLRTPTLLSAGLRDRATPPGQAVEMFRALRARGVPCEVALYPEEGHGVGSYPAAIDLVTRIVAWFERHMPAASPGS